MSESTKLAQNAIKLISVVVICNVFVQSLRLNF